METVARYATLKALGRCANCGSRDVDLAVRVTCDRCAATRQRYYDRVKNNRRLAPGPNRIAHCGSFHPLTALPWACPACGEMVGLYAEEISDDL